MPQVLRVLALAGCLVAGVVLVVLGILNARPALFAWAVLAFFGGVTGYLYAAKGQPSGGLSPPQVGGKFMGLPDWVLIADAGLLVIAVILGFVL